MRRKVPSLFKKASIHPTIGNIRQHFVGLARYEQFRHRLIRNSVRKSIESNELPLQAQYGSAHSTLSAELRKEGIETTRSMPSTLFTPDMAVYRKLTVLGLNTKLSDIELKRGFLAALIKHTPDTKKELFHRDFTKDFDRLVNTTLINRLTEAQVDEILSTGNVECVFTFNGLPENPSRTQLVAFLDRHSSFWKRRNAILETRVHAKK
ncbi:MAG: hypothetical protein Q7R47_05730 [Candidatus Diapherotrites archaeon]|nr:hypothetical protein [Candidatus Diapherotrites archaeon]